MASTEPVLPGEPVDLSNCEREPIHIPGRIQSFGALISVSRDWMIDHASDNLAAMIGHPDSDVIGQPITACLSEKAVHDIRSRLQLLGGKDAVERLFGIALTESDCLYDLAVHASGRSYVIEIERHDEGPRHDYLSTLRPMIDRLRGATSVDSLCDLAARQIKALTGFDRVMAYRFAPDLSGEVIAEAREPDIEPFLGLRYPASDIPAQARELYTRNLLRIISDVGDPGFPISPVLDAEGQPLDLSMSTTRAVSPIHLEYLRNMGVQASMSISLLRRGKLWGLLACHHYAPKLLTYELRSAAELFAQMSGFVLDQIESDAEREDAERARAVHDRIMANLAEGSSIAENFEAIVEAIGPVIPFTGAIGWIDGEFRSVGQTLSRQEFMALVEFLDTTGTGSVYATECLSGAHPSAAAYADKAAGLLALPVSRAPRDYMVLFRQEIVRSVEWAGNPDKPVEVGPNGSRLTPRKSFEAWKQTVENCCAPRSAGEIRAAESLRTTLLEVVLRITDASMMERSVAHERQEFLIAELNHRVRNILGLIRGLVGQSQIDATDFASFTVMFGGRIHALARAHDQITRQNWNPASCYDLIRTEAAAYLGNGENRVRINGPDAMLQPEAFSTLSLVMHELITNAAKYGALADSAGSIDIDFLQEPDGGLRIDWHERGGPPVKAPTRRGFGSTIIERSIPHEFQGHAEVRYDPAGLEALFRIPASQVAEFRDARTADPEVARGAAPLASLSGAALVVEDNLIIALDAERLLKELGAETVHVASNVGTALSAIAEQPFRFALLDVELGSATSTRVAAELRQRGIPFVFATGYGETKGLTAEFPGVPVLQKPYDKDAVMRAIAKIRPTA